MDFLKPLLIVAVLAAGAAEAIERSYAQIQVGETNVFLGQVFDVDILVKAPEKPDAANLDALTDFNIALLEAGAPTSSTNTWLYRYAFRAKREGELSIPSLHFGLVSTSPVTLHAAKPKATDRMKLEQTLSAQSVFLGEPVLLTTVWRSTYPFSAIKAVDFNFPILNDPRFQLLELHQPNKEQQKQSTGLPVHGTRVLATRKSYPIDGIQFQSLTFSKLLIPKKSGKMLFPSATLLCAAEQQIGSSGKSSHRAAFQYPAFFDNTFFDQNVKGDQWVRIYTESKPIELNVKPLPSEGRPDLFNGMVGNYTLHVEAAPTEVRVDEPITLTITITAEEYMENIAFPPLRYQPELVNHFAIPTSRSLPRREGKSKIYTQTIRPLSTNQTEIPPLYLAFFNPASKAYITAQSEPVPLVVLPSETIGIFGDRMLQSRLQAAEGGIRQNYENPDLLESHRPPLLGWAHPLIVLVLLLLPPLGVGLSSLILLFSKKKHYIHRTAKAARAYKVFRKNAKHIGRKNSMKSDVYGELDPVLRAYLGDRLLLVPGALSFREVEALLAAKHADPETIHRLKQLFDLCEAYRFTDGFDEQTSARKTVRKATRTIKAVERSLR